jgi:uncharacterized glyoxalase superfamily protein PhnB
VTIEVTFESQASGTRVQVTGTVPDGVDGTAQLSMLRMAPQWFPRYLDRRSQDVCRPDYGRLHLVLPSATPAATARWLAEVFQLEATADIPNQEGDPDYTWIELRVGNSFLVLWGGGGQTGTDWPSVCADDLDAHLKDAEAAGARIISPIAERGFRSCSAVDWEGRHWIFAQNGPRIGR